MNATNETRPSNPAEISFAPHCFEQVGTKTVYRVARMAPNYPIEFDNEQEARDYAAVRQRLVAVCTKPIMHRVSWR
jgi:hypothetical protein